MEIAGLAVGAIPLIIAVTKAYTSVHNYTERFRQADRTINRLFFKVNIQKIALEVELDAILQAADPTAETRSSPLSTKDLIRHAHYEPYLHEQLDKILPALLLEHMETFKGLLQVIFATLQEVEQVLEHYALPMGHRGEATPITQTPNSMAARMRMSVSDERRLKSLLEDVREDIHDIRTIRNFVKPLPKAAFLRRQVSQMPAEVITNKAVIAALHESLKSCWTCIDPDHADHIAKLCLEPLPDTISGSTEQEIGRELAIACMQDKMAESNAGAISKPIWLYVRSIMQADTSSQCSPPASTIDNTWAPCGRLADRRDRVCQVLSDCSCRGKSPNACLIVHKPQSQVQHLFYHYAVEAKHARNSDQHIPLSHVVSDKRVRLSREQQYILGRRLSLSVLELFGTPWLSEQWRTKDVSTFAIPPTNDEAFLIEQLHVTSALGKAALPASSTANLHWAICSQSTSATPDPGLAMLSGRIVNDTLFSLGVALLEVAHGATIEACRRRSDANLWQTIQRIAQRGCPLGESYRQLALQCLHCDFACGSDLREERLQAAVYTDVVCRLQQLKTNLASSMP